MPTEKNNLTVARELLARFETEMDRPEGLVHLSEALSLITDIQTDCESEDERQVALRLPLTYAKRVQQRVETLLVHEQPVCWETLCHLQKVFGEFEDSAFALPQDVAETRSKLQANQADKMIREIELMPAAERNRLIERLQTKIDN